MMSRSKHYSILFLCLLALASCNPKSDGNGNGNGNGGSGVIPPQAASVNRRIQVSGGLDNPPFDVPRFLLLPPGFEISVYARLESPRFMTITSNGDLLVSQPFRDDERRNQGNIMLFRPTPSGIPNVYTFATGLTRAHDLVLHTIDGLTYLYIAETYRIQRCIYTPGQTSLDTSTCEIIIDGLPDARSDIGRSYGHELKNIALDRNHRLFVSIASACNACIEDTQSSPVRGAIYVYTADGKNGQLYAQGLRNATGLAIFPNSNQLWVTVANRDSIRYPYQNDFDGDGNIDYDTIIQGYLDNHPPDLLVDVRQNSNYGWPFCNANPGLDPQTFNYDNMPFEVDVETNENESIFSCSTATTIRKGIQAHSTPLGLLFLQNTNVPAAYKNGLAVAYRGSDPTSISTKKGYKIAYFTWNQKDRLAGPGDEIDLVTGFDQWLNSNNTAMGRPVDIAVDNEGNMFISDDTAGAIYKLRYNGE
jgi:glucose/arabinose dehydrogenase